MKDYMVIHQDFTDKTHYKNYNIYIEWERESPKDAIVSCVVNDLIDNNLAALYKKATSTLTDLECIQLHNYLFDGEDEIIGVYEISKEIYIKKNSLYFGPLDDEELDNLVGDENEKDIDGEV